MISLGWLVLLLGTWWPQQQPDKRIEASHAEMRPFQLDGVGPLQDCSANLPFSYEDQLNFVVQNYRKRLPSNARGALILRGNQARNLGGDIIPFAVGAYRRRPTA